MMRRILRTLRDFDVDEVKLLCERYRQSEASRPASRQSGRSSTRKSSRRSARKSARADDQERSAE